MSVKLAPKADGSIELQNTAGTPLLTFDSSGNVVIANEVSDQDGRLGFGVGQTLQDLTASRAYGVTYTNTTDKMITVFVAYSDAGTTNYVTIETGSANWYDSGGNVGSTAIFFVLPGDEYSVTSPTGSPLSDWWEIRE